MTMPMFVGRSPSLVTISLQASASEYDDTTITIPAGAGTGDLGIFVDMGFDEPLPPSTVTPSGWNAVGTSLTANSIEGIRHNTFYRVLQAGDPGSNITGMSSTGQTVAKTILVFRKTSGTWGTPQSINGQATSGNPTLQTVTVGAGSLIVIGAYGCGEFLGSYLSGLSFSPTQDGTVGVSDGSGFISYVYYKIYNGSASNTDVDMPDCDDVNAMRSFCIGAS